KEEGAPEVTIFHCFSGDEQMARECAAEGYFMSFAGNLTFKNAEELRRAAAAAPLELLLTETDAPFLTPHPHRGKPGGPYLTAITARKLAEVRGVSEEELCSAVWNNAEAALGGWDRSSWTAGCSGDYGTAGPLRRVSVTVTTPLKTRGTPGQLATQETHTVTVP